LFIPSEITHLIEGKSSEQVLCQQVTWLTTQAAYKSTSDNTGCLQSRHVITEAAYQLVM